jgi:multiple sugar transport system substrate-binding protein
MASRELLTRVAYLYYERDLKQREIARLLGLSRSKVSRLLSEARKCGVVEIRLPMASSFSTAINWRQVAAKYPSNTVTIHVLMMHHSFTESLLPLIPEFEELTGIKVLYHVLSTDEYFQKLTVDLASGGGLVDLFMTGQYTDWQFIYPGWIEPLDSYLHNPELTDSSWYDIDDFYPEPLAAHRWDRTTWGQGMYGTGSLYAIPVTYEIMSLCYRTDLFERAGIQAGPGWPHTWDDILSAAQRLTVDSTGDRLGTQCGIISRGALTWESMFGGYSNIFYSYGGLDFDADMRPALTSEQSIEATTRWVELMRTCASPAILDLYWPQVREAFAAGDAAMIIDCDWFAPATLEKPQVSKVAGKLAYAATPPGPDGRRVQDSWFWSLAMNSASYHKEAAWLFIQWATSKPVMLHTTLEYENWNPPRKSVWEDPEVVQETKRMANYRQVVESNRMHGKIAHSVNPHLSATHAAWWSCVRDAIEGKVSVQDALARADRKMRELMPEL